MRWILKFTRAGDDPYGPGIFVRVDCSEEELQGEKERQGMRLEKGVRAGMDLRGYSADAGEGREDG